MKQVTPKKIEVSFREFEGIGVVIEKTQKSLLENDYGKYNIEEMDLEVKIAFKILEGMDHFQRENNKGIKFHSDEKVEIYNINEHQKIMNDYQDKFKL
jgi:hypothetical protein